MNWVKDYLINILAAISHLCNAVIGGNPNLTVSARCHLMQHHWFWGAFRNVLNWAFWMQKDHCKESWRGYVVFCETVRRHG